MQQGYVATVLIQQRQLVYPLLAEGTSATYINSQFTFGDKKLVVSYVFIVSESFAQNVILGPGTKGSAKCTSIGLTSLTVCTFSN
jgi:hypothetical protein